MNDIDPDVSITNTGSPTVVRSFLYGGPEPFATISALPTLPPETDPRFFLNARFESLTNGGCSIVGIGLASFGLGPNDRSAGFLFSAIGANVSLPHASIRFAKGTVCLAKLEYSPALLLILPLGVYPSSPFAAL